MYLLHRAKSICSTFELYMQELKRLRNIFHENEKHENEKYWTMISQLVY